MFARGEEFPTAGLETVDATARQFGGEFSSTNSTLGFYAQEQLNLRDRLFLTGAVRVDDNSAFGENFEWITYPEGRSELGHQRGAMVQTAAS